jgi:hypothetical protein
MGKRYWHPDNCRRTRSVDLLDLRASLAGEHWTATI